MSSPKMKHHNNPHIPVLLDKVVELLNPKQADRYLDLTAGFGSHAAAVLSIAGTENTAVLVDRDQTAVESLNMQFPKATIRHESYADVVADLYTAGDTFDLVLMDLGVSSLQLDEASRGFSFKADAPLDMRMDQRQALTAQDVVNSMTRSELEDILLRYGEEPQAETVAKLITSHRPLYSTQELADLISHNIGRTGKIHPATRTFQAIRIFVNDEIGQLESALETIIELLNPGGRLAVISFHSLEDRVVKTLFKEHSRSGYEATITELTKKPIRGSDFDNNPRARSAMLRAIIKNTKTKKKGD